jgi:drug/metabolite transporter (DMT)-like permease
MRVPRSIYFFLALGLVAASQSGNIIRLGDAHPVAMAAWRLFMAALLMAAFAGRGLGEIRLLSRRDKALLFAAGAALSAHLITWIAAVQHTKVANAAIFFAVNPVITSIAARFLFGEPITMRLAAAVALGMAGTCVIGYDDFHVSRENVTGDALAILCSFLFTAYFMVGRRLRRTMGAASYVAAVYGTAALVSFAAVAFLGLPIVSYDSRTWLCFILLAVVPTAIGHTSFNAALRYIDASKISAATLTEPAMAGAVAWLAWGERMDAFDIAGYCLICLSVLVLIARLPGGSVDGAAGRVESETQGERQT